MKTKIDFLINAIKEAQTTNDFLDKKAGVMVALESSLIAIVVNSSLDYDKSSILKEFFRSHTSGLILLLFFVVCVLVHILFTLRVILPHESPESHVELGDYKPRRLYFLNKLETNKKIYPSHTEFISQLFMMNDEDIAKEYTFELLKLSYIRKMKIHNLTQSLKLLKLLLIAYVIIASVWYCLSFLS